MEERHCAYDACRKPFTGKSKARRYCTDACRWHAWDERNPRLPSDLSRFQADFGHPHAPAPSKALLTARESVATLDSRPLPDRCRAAGAEPWPELADDPLGICGSCHHAESDHTMLGCADCECREVFAVRPQADAA